MKHKQVTIYHNPKCSKSREVLALIRSTGIEPTLNFYLQTPPNRAELATLIADLGMSVRDMMRRKDKPYEELGLDDPKWNNEDLIGFMLEHPVLINRPIVTTARGTRLCRPSELVLDILPVDQSVLLDVDAGRSTQRR